MVINNFDKQALKENSYTVLSRITIVGTDTVFTEEDAIVDWNYEDYRYVPGTGFIGQFVERILDGNLQNISEDVVLEDKEINLQIGIVNGLNEQTTWYNYGNFLITNVSETDTTGNFKFESCDYTKKFNTIYEDNISYPTISLALANDVCSQANVELQPDGYCHFYVIPEGGLTAGDYNFYYNGTYYNFTLSNDLAFYDTLMYVENTETLTLKTVDSSFDVTRTDLEVTVDSSATGTTLVFTRTPYVDFTNNDFVIENNQYESEDTLRKVMQDIGKLAYSWVRVAEDNKVYIDFEQKSEESVDTFDELSTDEYYTSKKSDLYFGPVNKVLIGMKDVEGENLYKTSDDYTEETECSLKIFDNNLTYTDELRAIALNGCEKLFGLKYMPLQIETIGHPWLEGNELIKLTNVDEEELYTYPFNRQIKYAGYIEGVIGAEAQTSQETEYEYTKDIISDVKKTRFIVDKDNQRIDSLIERTEGSESRITELEQTTEGITATVEHLNDEYEQNVVIKKTADGNPIEVEDAGHYQLNDFKIYGNTEQDGTPTPTNPVDVQTITSKGNTTHFEGDNFEVQNDYDESLELVERSDMEFNGNTEQDTLSGKNLFNKYGALNYPTDNNSVGTDKTTLQSDGTLKTTANFSAWRSKGGQLKLKPNTQYTLSGKLISSTGDNPNFAIVQVMGYGSSWTSVGYKYLASTGDFSFTFNSGNNTDWFLSLNANGSTSGSFQAIYDNIQVEEGSTKTDYQEYCGGIPSPNPNYPQNIEVVTGNQVVDIHGKNLFDDSSINNKWISSNGEISTITGSNIVKYNCAPNDKFTLTATYSNIGGTGEIIAMAFYDINDNLLSRQAIGFQTTLTLTMTAPANTSYMYAGHYTVSPSTIQLEKGNQATTYEPYIGNTYEVNLGKNLFEGEYIFPTTTTPINAHLTKGTYTLSLEDKSNFGNVLYIQLYKGNTLVNTNGHITNTSSAVAFSSSSYWYYFSNIPNGNYLTFTLDDDYNLKIAFSNATSTQKAQLEKGNQATSYSPYFTPIELCKIGNYQDKIYKSGDTWYLHKEIGKVVYNGSETWNGYTSLDNTDTIWLQGSVISDASNQLAISRDRLISNNFNTYNCYNPSSIPGICYHTDRKPQIRFPRSLLTGDTSTLANRIASFKTWLSTHNTEVYYVLATPTDTEITNEELINQLESINNLEFFDGLNNYTTTSSNLPIQNKFDITNTNYEVVTISDDNDNTLTHRILMKDFELCEIGEYRDYLYFDSGKWYKHSEIGKMIFNGTENWYKAVTGTNTNLYYTQLTYISADVLSKYFTRNDSLYAEDVEGMRGVTSNNRMWFRISNTTASDANAFKTWLSIHNTEVYYILATPTNEEITDTAITNTLNEILQSYLYKGYNEIYLHDEIADKIEITYLTDSILNSTYAAKTQLALTEESLSATVERTTALENNVTSLQLGINGITTEVTSVKDITSDLENSINYLNIELSGNSIIIPTNDENLPYVSTTYTIPYTATFKGNPVTPTVTTSDTATGITVSFATGQIKVAVSTTTAITSLTNTFNINFTYTNEGQIYPVVKTINVGLSVKGENGKDGTSVTILGSYDTLAQLQAAHPTGSAGDSYMVGEDLYVWSATASAWVDVGQIRGDNGVSSYVHIRYSENETGNPMTVSPTATSKYIGLVSTDSETAPTSYTLYTWSQYAGTNGETTYVHIKYSEDGSTFVEATDDVGEGDTPSAWVGVLTDTNEEASTNFDDYTWYKFTEDIDAQLTELQNAVSENKTNIENNNTAIIEKLDDYAKADVVATLKQTVETNQSDTEYAISVVKDLQVNGVSQVRTAKGFTFNDDGLTIDETNSVTKGIYDTNGVSIIDKTGSSNSEVFFAGYDEETHTSIVRTNNLSVSTYFNIGTKSRFEDYEDGTGVFI